jgi:hypothetical protein
MDALPGLGHACGHNIIAAAGVPVFNVKTFRQHLNDNMQLWVVRSAPRRFLSLAVWRCFWPSWAFTESWLMA